MRQFYQPAERKWRSLRLRLVGLVWIDRLSLAGCLSRGATDRACLESGRLPIAEGA
jgi:hypothetical protein